VRQLAAALFLKTSRPQLPSCLVTAPPRREAAYNQPVRINWDSVRSVTLWQNFPRATNMKTIIFTALLAATMSTGFAAAASPSRRVPFSQSHAQSRALTAAQRARLLRNPRDPFWTRPAPPVYRVKIETTKGAFVLEVTRSLAPRGADRFYHLVQAGFYDNSRFYRVIAGRFVQFGIAGDPAIAQVWQHAAFPDDPVRASNTPGTFAFAMTGPNARTTQIYINTGDQSRLDKMGFAPFGKVVAGMDVVDSLYSGHGERSGGGMRAGHQAKLFDQGNAYLDRNFPRLDHLLRAAIVPQ
jgi:cyclophilin family peptidyl-prolyl cis-trans isomerase